MSFPTKPKEFHTYFVSRCNKIIDHATIDQHKNPGIDILRGILGAFIAAATFGFALCSSSFCQFFFYTKTRAALGNGINQLNHSRSNIIYSKMSFMANISQIFNPLAIFKYSSKTVICLARCNVNILNNLIK